MIVCPHCDYENKEDERLCARCGLPLKPPAPPSNKEGGGTRLLNVDAEANRQVRWGTASLGSDRKLLLHVRGYDRPLVVSLTDSVVLGRYDPDTGEAPDIDLGPFEAQDQGVSRRHAAILVDSDALKIMDLGSSNSTFMNGQKLMAHQARILRDGDEIRLAGLVVRVNFA